KRRLNCKPLLRLAGFLLGILKRIYLGFGRVPKKQPPFWSGLRRKYFLRLQLQTLKYSHCVENTSLKARNP
ncbi:MAG: hypothetical protein ACO3AF_09430, partial [Flavobacteriales bacterium]